MASPLSWRAGAGFFLLAAGCNILIGLPEWQAVLGGQLNDPDSYMRLVRLQQGIAQGHLLNRVARDDSGAGVLVEWSRLLDALLWLMAAPLAPFLGWRQALLCAGVASGPLAAGALGLSLVFLTQPFARRAYLWAGPVAGAVLPGIAAFALPGVIHHHILLLALIILTAGLVARAWNGNARAAALAGAAGGLAIWLTPETFPFILAAYAALLFRWMQTPLPCLRACAAAFLATLLLAWGLDPPDGGYFALEADRLSVVYAALGFGLFAASLALPALPRRWLALPVFACALLLWIALFPHAAIGPYGLMRAADAAAFFGAITETQPPASLAAFGAFLLPGLLAMLYAAWRAGQNLSWLWAYLAFCGLVALLLGAKFILFSEFSAGFAAALLPILLTQLQLPGRLAVLFLILLAPQLAALPHPGKPQPNSPSCTLSDAAALLAPIAGTVVLADPTDTPELLYRTNILTVGSLYHHGIAGFLRARAAWASQPDAGPPAALRATQARFILFCPSPGRSALVYNLPPVTLWDRLNANRPPPWLRLRAQSLKSGWKLYALP